jgi:8-oxo-dGTP pyrophosphatase MutT (NUDIX family)
MRTHALCGIAAASCFFVTHGGTSTWSGALRPNRSFQESYEQAAQREAFEELGLTLPLRALGTFKHDDPPEHQFVAVFAMEHTGEPIKLDPTEASQGAFYSASEVARIIRTEPCTPWLRDGFALLDSAPGSRDDAS